MLTAFQRVFTTPDEVGNFLKSRTVPKYLKLSTVGTNWPISDCIGLKFTSCFVSVSGQGFFNVGQEGGSTTRVCFSFYLKERVDICC